ncbi:MAG: hypothetical protein JW993_20585 [Sedimentisphaerales bacterium]|nr:hypothetical protein [Sedimentisphaerales bacterium]
MKGLCESLEAVSSDPVCTPSERDVRELFRLRGNLLGGEDRALIAMYLEGGETVRRIATLAAVNPSSVARRIRAIIQRLTDPTYPVCLAHRQQFSTLELRVVKDYFVRGLSISKIRRRRNLGRYRVRAAIRKARACASAATTPHQTDEEKG